MSPTLLLACFLLPGGDPLPGADPVLWRTPSSVEAPSSAEDPFPAEDPPVASVPGQTQAPGDPLVPDTVLTPPWGPRTVVTRAPGAPVMALRLHIPLRERSWEGGFGEILMRMGVERARGVADQVGARVEGVRTGAGIAYTVTGPPADFDHLVWVLRRAMAEPDPGEFASARRRVLSDLERAQETPGGVLAQRLRSRMAPEIPPPAGRVGTLEATGFQDLLATWHRTHRRDQTQLVLVGPVATEAILAALLELGLPAPEEEPSEVEAPRDSPSDEPTPDPEVLRHWYGEAYPASSVDDPRSLVAGILLSQQLRERPGRYEASVEVWEVGDRAVVAVAGAAFPQQSAEVRSRIQELRREVAENLSNDQVEGAIRQLHREILMEARTPGGLANVLGRRMEGTGEPESAVRYLDRLTSVDRDGMATYLEELVQASPVTGEVHP